MPEHDGGQRLVSLAAGTVLDIGPAETVSVAARAGYDGVGLWFDPDSWTDATTREVAFRLDATGLTPLDMEPVILGRDVDPGDALVDTAGELGVRHVLVAGGPASHAAVVDRFGELCDRAAPAGVSVVLEFLPIFTIATLHDAVVAGPGGDGHRLGRADVEHGAGGQRDEPLNAVVLGHVSHRWCGPSPRTVPGGPAC